MTQELSGTTPSATLLSGLALDETFVRTAGGAASVLLPDALNSTIALAGTAGAVQTRYGYDPFGATASGAASGNPYQYIGRENDGDGLYYLRARYYSPGLGVFIAPAASGVAGGDANAYRYAAADPVLFADPGG